MGEGPAWDPVRRLGAYHGHLLLEVFQVPAILGGLALLRRTLVIFLVLRDGDTIAVRATRLRARRRCGGTGPPNPPPAPCLSVRVSGRVTPSALGVSQTCESRLCLWPHVLLGVSFGQSALSLLLHPYPRVTAFCLCVSFYFCVSPLSLSPRPRPVQLSKCLSLVSVCLS